MPKVPAKFEDWTPPWKDDEFDADKAARLIYNLHVEKQTASEKAEKALTERDEKITELSGKVEEYETKDLNEVERLKRENEKLKQGKSEPSSTDDLTAARLEIALDKGLTKAQAKRLAGSTREELEADADAYIEEHGLSKAGEGEGSGAEKPPTRRPTGNLKTGSEAADEPTEQDLSIEQALKDLPPSRF